MKKSISIIATVALFLTAITAGYAETNRVFPVSGIGSDVRSAGMANANTSLYGRGFSIYTNFASTALEDNIMSVSAQYSKWLPNEMNANYLALGGYYKLADRYTIGLGVRTLLYEEHTGTDITGIPTGPFTPMELSVDAAFGMRIIDGLSAAVNLHFFYGMYQSDVNVMGVGADVDLMYKHKYFTAALSGKNLGPNTFYSTPSPLPMEVKLGVSSKVGDSGEIFKFTPAIDASYLINSSAFTAAVGGEFKFIDLVSVRGGYRFSTDVSSIPTYATVGLGFDFFGVSLDAAYYFGLSGCSIGNSFQVGLSYSF